MGLGVVAAILVGAALLWYLNEWRKDRIRARTEEVWPGGHVASPVRVLEPGYGLNDPGHYVWHWRCTYCGETHRHLPGDGWDDGWSEECPL